MEKCPNTVFFVYRLKTSPVLGGLTVLSGFAPSLIVSFPFCFISSLIIAPKWRQVFKDISTFFKSYFGFDQWNCFIFSLTNSFMASLEKCDRSMKVTTSLYIKILSISRLNAQIYLFNFLFPNPFLLHTHKNHEK